MFILDCIILMTAVWTFSVMTGVLFCVGLVKCLPEKGVNITITTEPIETDEIEEETEKNHK